jgi:hypothetical protein
MTTTAVSWLAADAGRTLNRGRKLAPTESEVTPLRKCRRSMLHAPAREMMENCMQSLNQAGQNSVMNFKSSINQENTFYLEKTDNSFCVYRSRAFAC